MSRISEELKIYTYGNPANQEVIFIHGFPYDNTMWNQQTEALQHDFFCVTYDIRGLGKSSVGHGQFTMETFADDLFAIIEEYKLDKPVLCGLSMGGYLSFRAVERNQDKFKAVIFCDTKAEADNNEGKLKRAASIKKIDTEGLAKFVQDFIPTCFSQEYIQKEAVKFNYIIEKAALSSPLGVKGSQLAMLSRTDSASYLTEIKIPTLIICGEFDKLCPPAQMKELAEKIPGSSFEIIPKAGHMSPIENAPEFNNAVLAFLKKL